MAREAASNEVKTLRAQARDLKETFAEKMLENWLRKNRHHQGWGQRRMRHPATEKLEIIRLVEPSRLLVLQSLRCSGILKTSFYRWYDRYQAFGGRGLEDRNSRPGRIWNPIPDVM